MQESSVDMAITTDLVEAFLKSPTQCFLRARAEVATGNAYANWVRTKSEVFRSEWITRLAAGIEPAKCATSTAATECGRSAQWQLALDFTAGRENLRRSFDAVERLPSAGRGRAAQFVPIRFVFRAGEKRGKQPLWLSKVMGYHIQPIASKLWASRNASGGIRSAAPIEHPQRQRRGL